MCTESVATVLMSGGIDSTACAHLLRRRGFVIRGVFFDYGQAAAAPERLAVEAVSAQLSISVTHYRISGGGTYTAGELIHRNCFLVSAALLMLRQKSGIVAIGVHAGTPYFDCSPQFIKSVDRVVSEQTDGRVRVVAPFLKWTKAQVLQYFKTEQLPTHLTYSCEAGTNPSCGSCSSCRDRRGFGC